MGLNLDATDGVTLDDGWVRKPFVAGEGFRDSWWLEQAKGPLRFYVVNDDDLGEVARVQVSLEPATGDAYSTWNRPVGGVVEIDLIEVRSDLRTRHLGAATVNLVQSTLDHPLIAVSLDAASDAFWRSLGWAEHVHEDSDSKGDDSAALLFSSPLT